MGQSQEHSRVLFSCVMLADGEGISENWYLTRVCVCVCLRVRVCMCVVCARVYTHACMGVWCVVVALHLFVSRGHDDLVDEKRHSD